MAKARQYPKGVWFQKKRLSSAEVVRYGYWGRGPGTLSLGREGSVEFYHALAEAMAKAPSDGTVASLIWKYRQSPEFTGLRPRTQADYRQQLDKVQAKFGVLSLRAMSAKEIAGHIYAWRDSMAGSPRRADYAVQVLKATLAWGVRRGLLDHNRAAGIERLYKGDRSASVWTADHVTSFLDKAPEPLKRAMILAIETGQSQEDLLVMSWTAVGERVITGRRLKTGVPIAVPVSPDLRKCLEAVSREKATTILTKADGLPWDPKGNGFRAAWRDVCEAARISGLTFNDLRGTFITRRRQLGWAEEEVALCSGHPMAKRGAFHAYVDRAAVALANAERLAATYYGSEPERDLQTGLQTAPEGK